MPDCELTLRLIEPVDYLDHASLRLGDVCYCLGEYTAHRGNSFSPMNQLIGDFKIKPASDGIEAIAKDAAMRTIANAFRCALTTDSHFAGLRTATLVPTPPSAVFGDSLHDDRMLRLVSMIGEGLEVDVRELVKQHTSTKASRGADLRPSVSEIASNYYIDETLAQPYPKNVWVFDDVLTGGNHYKAMESVIIQRFPLASTIGIFIARRAPEEAARLSWREKLNSAHGAPQRRS